MRIIRQFLETFLDNSFYSLVGFIERKLKERNRFKLNRQLEESRAAMQSCGANVHLATPLYISQPRMLAIGNNVEIKGESVFLSEGGLTIGDNCIIGRNAIISTRYIEGADSDGSPKETIRCSPVSLGPGVTLGSNVSIAPGVRIGGGAVIMDNVFLDESVGSGVVVKPAVSVLSNGHDLKKIGQPRVVKPNVANQNISLPHGNELGRNLFFIATTGRSGSTSVASALSKNDEIQCLHEPRRQLIRISGDYAHGELSEEQAIRELSSIYCEAATYAGRISGESDQNTFNLIPLIKKIMPLCKFVWLVRDGRDVVSSGFSRGWFGCHETESSFMDDFMPAMWKRYRLDGSRCGQMSSEEWAGLSPFARNCWYWSFVNSTIRDSVENLSLQDWCMVRLEDLPESYNYIQQFLCVSKYVKIDDLKLNSSRPEKMPEHWSSWSDEKWEVFSSFCSAEMDRYYPEWNKGEPKNVSV